MFLTFSKNLTSASYTCFLSNILRVCLAACCKCLHNFANQLFPCGLLGRTPDSHASDGRFESDQKPTSPGESCGLSTVR